MRNPKHNKILAVFCWFSTALCAFLTLYLLYMARKYPEMHTFTQFFRLVGVLALLWLAAAVWFTVIVRSDKRDKK